MTKLLIASNNKHKIEEIRTVLNKEFDSILSLEEAGISCDPAETGTNFYENALIKARAAQQFADIPVLADDTGLCVNSLGGLPGINSARYAGDHNNVANRRKLLRELENKQDRSAYFACAIVLLYPDGKVICGNGRVDGHILLREKGENGFGYDSIFYCDELCKTFAEATVEEKLDVSHRSRALRDLLGKID